MTDTPPTHLEGFDALGVQVGTAQRTSDHWHVDCGHIRHACLSEAKARQLLRDAGAVTITESDGRK